MSRVRMRCSGLVLEADTLIPSLTPIEEKEPADVRIWLRTAPPWLDHARARPETRRYVSETRDERGTPLVSVWTLGADYYRFLYCDGTEFIVRIPGDEIWVDWPDDTSSLEDVSTYLLGPVVGLVLRLRGHTTLHASAVEVEGSGVAFVGPPRAGKSTTAAVFARHGHDVLTDDLVSLSESDGSFWVAPGHPVVRLWPNSVSILFGAEDALPQLTPNWGKRFLDLRVDRYSFKQEPVVLKRVYLLGNRTEDPEAPLTRPMSNREAFMELIANTYTNYLLNQEMRARDFGTLGRLIQRIPVKRLVARKDGRGLDRLRELVLEERRNS